MLPTATRIVPVMKNRTDTLDILYVEDDRTIAFALKDALGEHEFARVQVAWTLKSAIDVLRRMRFDLVLLDLGLQDSEGLGGVRSIRSATASPIVIYTGRAEVDDEESFQRACISAGADGYIEKSGDIRQLRTELRYILASHYRREGDRLLRGGSS